MGQNKKHITTENITEWLASTGFLFPRNEVELARFEKLYDDVDFGLTGNEIDPEKIINNTFEQKKDTNPFDEVKQIDFSEYKMAARNGKNLQKHIVAKILKNQSKPKDDSSATENSDK